MLPHGVGPLFLLAPAVNPYNVRKIGDPFIRQMRLGKPGRLYIMETRDTYRLSLLPPQTIGAPRNLTNRIAVWRLKRSIALAPL